LFPLRVKEFSCPILKQVTWILTETTEVDFQWKKMISLVASVNDSARFWCKFLKYSVASGTSSLREVGLFK
jgi:hypothetical protein